MISNTSGAGGVRELTITSYAVEVSSRASCLLWLLRVSVCLLIRFSPSLSCAALQIGRSPVRFQMVSLEIIIDIILQIALWPWGRLSL